MPEPRSFGGVSARPLAVALTLAALCVLALAGSPARAQEAPICLKVREKLDDGVNHWKGSNHRDRVTGLRGRDKMRGRKGNDRLNGGRDNDRVKGGSGDDTVCGGRGGDKLYGGPGDDIIYGEEENDKIYPGPGDDKVLGSAGNDRIRGWGRHKGEIVDDGTDILDGGFNDDVVEAGGADSLFGYTHNDTLQTKTPLIAPRIMDGGGNDDDLFGSEVDDDMRGGENGRDTLYGAAGNDRLVGQGNDDELYGQIGDDELSGGDGFDLLNGGVGTDVCDGGELPDRAEECERTLQVPRIFAARSFAPWR